MKKFLPLVVGLSAPACGAEVTVELTPGTKTYRSGERLQALVVSSDGGASRFYDWYDTELDARCSFEVDAGGTWRCLPIREGSTRVLSTDAACTQPVIVDGGCGGTAYASAGGVIYRAASATTANALFEVDAENDCRDPATT